MLWQLMLAAAALLAPSQDGPQSPEISQEQTFPLHWPYHPHHYHPESYMPRTLEALKIAQRALQSKEYYGGDMILPDDISNGISVDISDAAINDERYRWPGARVPYVISDELAGSKDLIEKAMKQYHDNTCVRFVRRTNEDNYVRIFRGVGCYARVGRNGGGQDLSLGDGCLYVGTIVHELGHALGFFHEHQRSDRDRYIYVYEQNVLPGQLHNFNKTLAKDEKRLTSFNKDSIMIYGDYAFSKQPGWLKTMEDKNHEKKLVDPYLKPGMDATDIRQVKKLYNC